MAQKTLKIPGYVSRLTDALKKKIRGAEVDRWHIDGDRYRFIVVAKRFKQMDHPERQRLVWDIADAELEKRDLMKILMIITMSPEELPD